MEKIFRFMHVTNVEGLEFEAYNLKGVAYQLYEEWDQARVILMSHFYEKIPLMYF